MKILDLVDRGKKVIMNTYNRYPIAIEHGEGAYVWDTEGKKYLDFVAGIAVNSLGNNNEKLVKAISEQASKVIHCSNYYWNEPMIELAELLVENTCFDRVFYCNSGAEANEGALKLARKYATKYHKNDIRFEIVSMKNSFHGRTYAAITATGQPKYQKGLNPLMPGIKYAEFNDFDSLKKAVNSKTCAVILEPIQGESGIHPASKEYLQKVRDLCDLNDILLIFDEVQCGVGRTGELCAYQYYDIEPDVLTFAKGLAGGVPIGALLTKEKAAQAFEPGDHASTFGGNPLATAAGKTVIKELLENGVLENVYKQGNYLTSKLNELKSKKDVIKEIRGIGLMQGIELDVLASDIINKAMEKGLLLASAGSNVIRFVPSLIVTSEQIDEMIDILSECI